MENMLHQFEIVLGLTDGTIVWRVEPSSWPHVDKHTISVSFIHLKLELYKEQFRYCWIIMSMQCLFQDGCITMEEYLVWTVNNVLCDDFLDLLSQVSVGQ